MRPRAYRARPGEAERFWFGVEVLLVGSAIVTGLLGLGLFAESRLDWGMLVLAGGLGLLGRMAQAAAHQAQLQSSLRVLAELHEELQDELRERPLPLKPPFLQEAQGRADRPGRSQPELRVVPDEDRGRVDPSSY
jgi:hypothetical protein